MRYLLPCLFFLFASTLYAQYERGNWWLDAASGAILESNPVTGGDLLQPNLKSGYFFADRWLLGARLTRPGGHELSAVFETRFTPFIRRYFPSSKSPKLHYFAEAGLGVSFEYEGVLPQLAAGLEYQLGPGIMLNGKLSGGVNTSDFSPVGDAGIGLQLGTNILFGGINGANDEGDYLLRKGDVLLDGNLGNLNYGFRAGSDLLFGNLRFSAGKMLSDQLMLEAGLRLGFSEFLEDMESSFAARSFDGSVDLGVRYFFNPGGRYQPYFGAGVQFDFWDYNFRYINDLLDRQDFTFNTQGFSLQAKGGFLYFLNDRVALDVNVGYRTRISGLSSQQDRQLFGSIGMKLFFGNQRAKSTPRN